MTRTPRIPVLILLLAALTPARAANDFSRASHCKALYRLEAGALTTDSKGGNTLANHGVTSAAAHEEGSSSGSFASANGQYGTIPDAALADGFPLKSGDTNKKISVTFWCYAGTLPVSGGQRGLVTKNKMGKQSFAAALYNSAGATCFIMRIGCSGANTYEGHVLSSLRVASGKWYHVGMTYQDSDRAWRIRVWDDTAQQVYETTGTGTRAINVKDADFELGRTLATNYWNGYMDEVAVFDDVLTADEIDQIRQGTYGATCSYYVDPVSGSNSNDGLSPTSAWATVAYAEQNAANGSTVYLMTGNHGDIILTDAANGRASMSDALTFTPLPGDTPTIQRIGIDANTNFYIILDGLTVTSPDNDRSVVCYIGNGSYITLQNCTVTGYLGWDAVNGRYDATVSTTIGIAVGRTGNRGTGNVIVDNCTVTNSCDGIEVDGTRSGPITVKNCTVYGIGGSLMLLKGGAGTQVVTFEDNRIWGHVQVWDPVINNSLHNSGFSIRGWPVTIQRNIVRATGTSAPMTFYRAVATETGYQDVLVQNNLIYDSWASAVTVKIEDAGDNFRFNNNTIIGFHDEIGHIKAQYYANAIGLDYCNSYTASTIQFCNNIILGYMGLPAPGTVFTGNHVWAVLSATGNWYDPAELDAAFPGNTVYSWNTATPTTFEPGDNAFGWAGSGIWPNCTYVHRHGQDISTGYCLTAASPAVGYADPAYAPSDDLNGNPRDASPDAGAVEY